MASGIGGGGGGIGVCRSVVAREDWYEWIVVVIEFLVLCRVGVNGWWVLGGYGGVRCGINGVWVAIVGREVSVGWGVGRLLWRRG